MWKFVGTSYDQVGLYKIINNVTNDFYIGSTSSSFRNRFNGHVYQLNRNKHKNSHLQHAWNKYGAAAFSFIIYKVLPNDKVIILFEEQQEIDLHYGKPYCYNQHPKAEGGGVSDRNVKKYSHVFYGPDGVEYKNVTNLSKFAREHGLTSLSVHQLISGIALSVKGYTIHVTEDITNKRLQHKEKTRKYLKNKKVRLRAEGKLRETAGRPKIRDSYIEAVVEFYRYGFSLRAINICIPSITFMTVKNILIDQGLDTSQRGTITVHHLDKPEIQKLCKRILYINSAE